MGGLIRFLLGLVALAAIVIVGAYFVLKRADIPWDQLEAKYANAQSRFVDLPNGAHVHYRDQGNPEGRTLLLLHGFGASLETWEPWVKRLGRKYRIVSVDLPGFGLTRPPPSGEAQRFPDFLDSFMNKLGLKAVAVAGNSMGGGAAWTFALAHPEHVDALILVDAGGWRGPQSADRPIIFKVLGNPLAARYIQDLDNTALIRQALQSAFINQAMVTDAMVQRYVDLSRAPGRRAALIRGMRGGEDGEATKEALGKIAAPTLILWGDRDHLINVVNARKFADAIKGSYAIVYPNVGHVPMEEVADKSAADVDAWLTQTTLAGAALVDQSTPKPPIAHPNDAAKTGQRVAAP